MESKTATNEIKVMGSKLLTETITTMVSTFGITPKAIQLATKTQKACEDVVKKGGVLKEMFDKISNGKNFVSEHSLLTGFIATQMALGMGLKDEASITKLSLAATFHDSTLDDELARVHH